MSLTIKIEPKWENENLRDLSNDETRSFGDNTIISAASITHEKRQHVKSEPINQFGVDVKVEPKSPKITTTTVLPNEQHVNIEKDSTTLEIEVPPLVSDEKFSILRDRLQCSNKISISNIGTNTVQLNDSDLSEYKTADHKYICPVCQKVIPYKSYFSRHIKSHKEPLYHCNICQQTFKKQEVLVKHDCKTYSCNMCDKIFRRSSNLCEHKRKHHAEKLFQCDICPKSFANERYLANHKSRKECKKNIVKAITCDCGKVFCSKELYRSHVQVHAQYEQYQCDHCKLYFKHKASLARHLNIHDDTRKLSCPTCNRKFSHPSVLKNHLRTHTGDRPYSCPVCTKTFSYKHNMKKHVLCHQKPKKLFCTICSKKFPKESRLVYHMRSHTNEKPFHCNLCPKRFTTKQNVVKHYQRWHPKKKYETHLSDATIAQALFKEIEEKQRPIIKKRIHEKFQESMKDVTENLKPNIVGVPNKPVEEVLIKIEPYDYSFNEDDELGQDTKD